MSPCASIRAPPVSVATIAPRHGSAPRSIGSDRPSGANLSFNVESLTPAGTIATRSSAKTSIGSTNRSVLRTTIGRGSDPDGTVGGTDAPTRPVLAPWGSRRNPSSTARRTTVHTCAVVAGRNTAAAGPPRPRAGSR